MLVTMEARLNPEHGEARRAPFDGAPGMVSFAGKQSVPGPAEVRHKRSLLQRIEVMAHLET
jgi:hypothetical protein